MKEVDSKFNFRDALNAEHYQVHCALLDVIPVEVASSLGCADQRDQYAALFEEERGCYGMNHSFVESDELKEKHVQRVHQFSYIVSYIDNAARADEEAVREAANVLLFVIKPHRAARRMRYAATSGVLRNFINQMRESECATHIATLRLTESINLLAQMNQAFTELYDRRSELLLARANAHKMVTIRPLVDKAFKELARTINALYRVNQATEKSESKEQQLATVIDQMNAILYQLGLTLSRTKARGKSKSSDTAEAAE